VPTRKKRCVCGANSWKKLSMLFGHGIQVCVQIGQRNAKWLLMDVKTRNKNIYSWFFSTCFRAILIIYFHSEYLVQKSVSCFQHL
jgi:hypothetical protein